jgi:hypothetical protein
MNDSKNEKTQSSNEKNPVPATPTPEVAPVNQPNPKPAASPLDYGPNTVINEGNTPKFLTPETNLNESVSKGEKKE